MNTPTQLTEVVRSALASPGRDVVGLVDELLRACPEQGLQLDWHADRCRIRFLTNGPDDGIDWAPRKSVFRAILARVAALCNERKPDSVSPYGGKGELAVDAASSTVLRVSFANTAAEQWLQVMPVRTESDPAE
jgi:hypothetical protein